MKRSLDLFLISILQTQGTRLTIPIHFQAKTCKALSELPAGESRRLSKASATGARTPQGRFPPPTLQQEEAPFFQAVSKFTHQHNAG